MKTNSFTEIDFLKLREIYINDDSYNGSIVNHYDEYSWPYIIRIICEWIQHNKLIVALDFDDTVKITNMNNYTFNSKYTFNSLFLKDITICEYLCNKTCSLIKRAQDIGIYLIVYTARKEKDIPEVIDYLYDMGIKYDTINENIPGLEYGNDHKPYANIYIDDRSSALPLILANFELVIEFMECYNKNKNLFI